MDKRKWLGSLLNFMVPGLGFVYGRKARKGILSYVFFFIVVFSLRFIAYNFPLFLISLALIIGYCLYLIIGGYRDVKRGKVYEPTGYDKWYTYLVLIFLHGILFSSLQGKTLDSLTPINFASIPTPAMEPTLQVGDIMAFRKTKSLERSDVAVFWFPDDLQTMFLKRCIGMPGDSLAIIGGKVLVNGVQLPEAELKFRYLVTTEGPEFDSRILEKNQIGETDYIRVTPDSYYFFLTDGQAERLRKFPFLRSIGRAVSAEGEKDPTVYPGTGETDWNTDFYGPIYIPKKGDIIELTGKNIDLYLKCVEFENDLVERDSHGLRINGELTSRYEFKDSYFFMMGDNRHNSLDSRYWGLLPQRLVIGKAMYLYWGRESGRIGKKVE